MFKNILIVGAGGAIGAMLRYCITLVFQTLEWSSNLGTFITNTVGSLAMGLLMSSCSQSPWMLMATVGVCGGFTTYSTFSIQSVTLLQQGKYGLAALYVFGTAVSCVIFAFVGYYIGQKLS